MKPSLNALVAINRKPKRVSDLLAAIPLKFRHPNPTTDWARFVESNREAWKRALHAARQGPQVLIATSVGGHDAMTTLESLLAVALTLRGAQVQILLCDGLLPACMQALSTMYPDAQKFVSQGVGTHTCGNCFGKGFTTYAPLNLPILRYSEFVTPAERAQAKTIAASIGAEAIPAYRWNNLAIGEHAMAGALRFFAKGELTDEPLGDGVLRRYLEAALLTAFVSERLLRQNDFSAAVFHHGLYVPQGIIGEVARARHVHVVNWTIAYRKQCFIFSHDDTYHHTLRDEPTAEWENMTWNETLEAETMSYLDSRWEGSHDWISFHEHPELQVKTIAQEIGIDFARPTIGLLTNVAWDAQLHYPVNAFPNMMVWIIETIKYFAARPDLQLLIRVHPAEIRGTVPSRQLVVEEIKKAFSTLPSNVFVIPPESSVSTYAAMLECDSVIIYGTKTGVELSSYGMPILVAGEAWIRNKGMTYDASTPREYLALLAQLPMGKKLDEATRQRARKYAYHFFFRRMIPLDATQPTNSFPPSRIQAKTLDDLAPGRDAGMDVICDGILNNSPFVYRREEMNHAV